GEDLVGTMALSPGGRAVAVCTGAAMHCQALGTGKVLWRARVGGNIRWLGFSPRGDALAVGTDSRITLLRAASGGRLGADGPPEAWVQGLASSADGRALAAAHDDGDVRLWDPRGGRQLSGWRVPGVVFPTGRFASLRVLPGRRVLAVTLEPP